MIAVGVHIPAECKIDIIGDCIANRIGTGCAAVVYIDNAACRKFERVAQKCFTYMEADKTPVHRSLYIVVMIENEVFEILSAQMYSDLIVRYKNIWRKKILCIY